MKIAKAWSNFQEKVPWMAPTANVDAPEGANRKFATVGGWFKSDSRLKKSTVYFKMHGFFISDKVQKVACY